MSSTKNHLNMTADAAATLIQSAWRSRRSDYSDYSDYYNDYYNDYSDYYNDYNDYSDYEEDKYEPIYDKDKKFLGYIDQEEMKNLCDPAYAKWVLDEEEGIRDPLIDRVASERLGRKYPPAPRKKRRSTKRHYVRPLALDFLTPSRYSHPDNASCSNAFPSPTCSLCFRYFCCDCGHGVGGMYSKCLATPECRERADKDKDLSLFK